MGGAYYNEHDPAAAAWLRELMRAGLIAPGDVDDREIQQVRDHDLGRYTQVHLFAGIGGWSHALRLAGWPDDCSVWTGSCPCQPFSCAGKHKAKKDARHLWPWMRHLMFRWRPAIAFGEQVASKDGREWLTGVRANLETLGYAVGAADLCAAGVASPHIRQRLFWVADSAARGFRIDRGASGGTRHTNQCGPTRWLGNAVKSGLEGHAGNGDGGHETGFWSAYELIPCRDDAVRRVEPGTFPLAHGVPGRVGLLRGYGNAIVPQLAANFVQAYVEVVTERQSHERTAQRIRPIRQFDEEAREGAA